ncbi:MAG TPA: HAD-IIIA family hydrolase [Usitatibacter sp.]|nr:HAD-IIIA family hydrolase [Usitatibacter sp.]
MDGQASERAKRVRLAIFDVDGVMTDGSLYFGPRGEALKVFNILDGNGLKLLQKAGIGTAIISGRKSPAVAKRARELAIEHVIQGTGEDKIPAFEKLLKKVGLGAEACSFMGDDVQDLAIMTRCGFAVAVVNAVEEVKAKAHYVTRAHGGRGAIREFCDLVLRAQAR